MTDYSVDLTSEEAGVVAEALRIQRERWNDLLLRKLRDDSTVSEIPLTTIREAIQTHDSILSKFPDVRFPF